MDVYGVHTPITLLQILESNGPGDCIWALRAVEQSPERDFLARMIGADCAEMCVIIYEAKVPNDNRPRAAIKAARAFARGEITEAARSAAWSAARAAARAAAWSAARAAAWAAVEAAVEAAAWSAARAAAGSAVEAAVEAAGSAARAAAWSAAESDQVEIIKKWLEYRP